MSWSSGVIAACSLPVPSCSPNLQTSFQNKSVCGMSLFTHLTAISSHLINLSPGLVPLLPLTMSPDEVTYAMYDLWTLHQMLPVDELYTCSSLWHTYPEKEAGGGGASGAVPASMQMVWQRCVDGLARAFQRCDVLPICRPYLIMEASIITHHASLIWQVTQAALFLGGIPYR